MFTVGPYSMFCAAGDVVKDNIHFLFLLFIARHYATLAWRATVSKQTNMCAEFLALYSTQLKWTRFAVDAGIDVLV